MAKKTMFLVVFFSKNRRLLLSLAALAAIVVAVWLIVAFTNWLVVANQEQIVPWSVVSQDKEWQGRADDGVLPRYFVAGGITYDQQILVDGWGISTEVLKTVDYMEDLGIHVLYGEVKKVTYSDHRLQVFIEEKQSGYQLISVSKAHLEEGDLQIVYVNPQGVPLSYEEEFVYSIPLKYTVVEAGSAEAKTTVFMEILDNETLPVLTGLDNSAIHRHAGSILLYVQGGEIATIQRNKDVIRIYTDNKPVYQVIALDTDLLVSGQNTIRLIDSADLSIKSQIIFWSFD